MNSYQSRHLDFHKKQKTDPYFNSPENLPRIKQEARCKKMKYINILPWSAAAFCSLFIPPAHASCTFLGAPPTDGEHYIYRPVGGGASINPNPNSFADGAGIGSIRMLMSVNTSQPQFTCTSINSRVYLKLRDETIHSSGAYPSGVAGIGFRNITIHENTFPSSGGLDGLHALRRMPLYINVSIDLIKTGPISSTGPFNGIFAYETLDGQILYEYRFNNDFITPPQKPTCTLKQVAMVDLGNHPVTRFTGIGTVTEAKDFEVEVNCQGGDTNHTAYMTFTDNTNVNNTGNVLSLHASNVSGLGVEVLHNGRAVIFGPNTAPLNAPNVKEIGTIRPGTGQTTPFSIPLKARYRQTGGSVAGGGPANAEMLLTVSYQ